MNARTLTIYVTVALAVLPAPIAIAVDASSTNSGTLHDSDQAYREPLSVFSPADRELFEQGAKALAQHWAVAPSILGLWGRGPTSNGEACTDCHVNGGRGRATDAQTSTAVSMLVRLSIPGSGPHAAPLPDPQYGDQLQEQGILGQVPAEGHAI